MGDPLDPVRTFAIEQHAELNQKYGDDLPYDYHLKKVEEVLKRFGETSYEMLAAAWLHDVVEDCNVTVDVLKAGFGPRIAELVWAVTNEPGANRKERHEKTYPKTRQVKGAIRLKLADRIANVEHCLKEKKEKGSSRLLGMYQNEFDAFVDALFVPGQEEDMWWHLKDLMIEEEQDLRQ